MSQKRDELNELPILNCDDCGACCASVGHPQFYRNSNDELWKRVPEHLKKQVNDHVDALTDIDLGQPCIWLDPKTKQCMHYEYRPQMCRDFEVGSFHCHRFRRSVGLE